VFVYIAEAHSTDGWQLPSNVEDHVLLARHRTLDDRFAAARQGVERLGLTMPVLVDAMDDAVSEAFAAWPERLSVVAADSTLRYVGGPGPFAFDPDEAYAVLDEL
jgi:iodothyronine deiodinase-like protein